MTDWLACSERAAFEEAEERTGEIPDEGIAVRRVVGSCVNAALTGTDYHLPLRIQFDESTRTLGEMERQVTAMTTAATMEIARQELTVLAVEQSLSRTYRIGDIIIEVDGRIDLRCRNKNDRTVIVDLKTGVMPPARVWPQLALYGLQEGFDCDVAILWVQRPKGARQPTDARYYCKPAEALKEIAFGYLRFRAYCQSGTSPTPSAMTCRDCPVEDCEVRAVT